MYDNVLKAREEGVNLAFFGGNSVLCVVPMLASNNGMPNRATRREGWFMPMPAKIRGWLIHHVNLSIALKEKTDALGLEAHLKYPGAETIYPSQVEFFVDQLPKR